MIDYAAARAVALVDRAGSFEAAARALGVTPSAVSQRVRGLEERLGVALIERGAPCAATEHGAWLCRHVERVGMLEAALMEHLPGLAAPSAEPVTLRLATNADSLATWLMPALAAFAAGSGWLLDVAVDDEAHTAEWLRRGRVAAAVTAVARPAPGCVAHPLGALRYVATASPAFMARWFPRGVTVEAVARAPALTFDRKDRLQQDWVRRAFGRAAPFPTHWMPSSHAFVDASLAGLGWAMNPLPLMRDHLAAGRLVALVPDAPLDRPLVWQVGRLAAPGLARLTEAIRAAAREALG